MPTFSDAEMLVRHIVDRTGGTIRLALPLGLGKPNTLVNALTQAAVHDTSITLEIFTALTLERPVPTSDLQRRFLEPALDRLFGNYPPLHYAELLHQRKLPENIKVSEFFLLAGKWLGSEEAQQNYISANYTHAFTLFRELKPNVIAQLVARNDEGKYSLSCNPDLTADLLALRRKGESDFLFACESNTELPFMGGSAAEIATEEIDALLDDPRTDFELFSAVKQPIQLAEQAIGLHASTLIEDGGTLQIGIGSAGDAMAQALLLRQHNNATYRAIVDAQPFGPSALEQDLAPFQTGLYVATEMLVDGLLRLFDGDVVKREVDGAAIHAGFFVESRSFYEELRTMPEERRAKIEMKSVAFTNSLYGDEEAKRAARQKARFVNSAMIATLLGAVVSDATGNGQVVSGVGGQFNFVNQAFALEGARSILTVKAARSSKGKTVSNIVWNYPHTTIPRHLRDIVVTEYGVADLRGKSDQETILAMLKIADSSFQDGLLAQAKDQGKVRRDYQIPAEFHNNTPAKLKEWLLPFRSTGVLPEFPFGTDFTKVEQRLLPALAALKQAQATKTALIKLAWTGYRTKASPEAMECLARMDLAAPKDLKERLFALLLRGALTQSLPIP